jgi:hypothetical protein
LKVDDLPALSWFFLLNPFGAFPDCEYGSNAFFLFSFDFGSLSYFWLRTEGAFA